MNFDINIVVSTVFLLVAYVGYLYISASDSATSDNKLTSKGE